MIERILEYDRSLFVTLNGLNSDFFDGIMVFASGKLTWIPLYLFMLFMLFYRKGGGSMCRAGAYDFRKGFLLLAGAIAVFAISDAVSFQIKNIVCRPRPCHEPSMEGIVRLLEGSGGEYGFYSSHAANVFAIAVFTMHYVKRRWYSVIVLFWAILVSYSRIYVGKHYPLDVVTGAIAGIAAAWVVIAVIDMLIRKTKILEQ